METTPPLTIVQGIDTLVLTPVVRKATQRNTLKIQEWAVHRMDGGDSNPVSLGVFRFSGRGQDQGEPIPWTVVLKIIQSPANLGMENFGEGNDTSHWNWWRREPKLFQSGLLDDIPGLVAPQCLGVEEKTGDIIWLWMEDIIDIYGDEWTLERYALAARHLGQFNGRYVADQSLLSTPWLSKRRIWQWYNAIPWQIIDWEHPLMLERYPKLDENTFQRMVGESDWFFEAFERLPQTFCHCDYHADNIKARDLPGQPQTVALDWALAGAAPVGADLGQLVFGVLEKLPGSDLAELDNVLFDSYLAGLKDSRDTTDPQLVRFIYTAYGAFHIALPHIFGVSFEIQKPESMSLIVQNDDRPDCFEVYMANQAYELSKGILPY